MFAQLESQRPAIEEELGLQGRLDWQPLPDKKACRIAIYKETGSLDDREQWPESFAWMLDWAEKFRSVFAQRIKGIVLPDPVSVEVEAPPAAATIAAPPPTLSFE